MAQDDEEADLLAAARVMMLATRRTGGRAEATLCGEAATSLVCWPHLAGRECDCGGRRAHICRGACAGTINAALGGARQGCKHQGDRCPRGWHATPEHVRQCLSEWWVATRCQPAVWGTLDREKSAAHGDRSAATAAEGRSAERRVTLPVAVQLDRLGRHAHESPYLARFLREPFLDALFEEPALRALLAMKKCAKEITEAYGAAQQVKALLLRHGADASSGRGAVVLDVCSGKGLCAALLSCMLPEARVAMFDANGDMDLAHVAALPRLTFCQLDIFSPDAAQTLEASAAGASVCVAVGTHLCGALSPRLVDLFCTAPSIDALVLVPCCIKGKLGSDVMRAARAARAAAQPEQLLVDAKAPKWGLAFPYSLLVRSLASLCEELMQEAPPPLPAGAAADAEAAVRVFVDDAVLSPANSFIVASKAAVPTTTGTAADMHLFL